VTQPVIESAIEALPSHEFFTPREAELVEHPPAVVAETVAAPEPKADLVMAAAEPEYEDELDVPAYLRQGKLVN
jgi:hypothetical protein